MTFDLNSLAEIDNTKKAAIGVAATVTGMFAIYVLCYGRAKNPEKKKETDEEPEAEEEYPSRQSYSFCERALTYICACARWCCCRTQPAERLLFRDTSEKTDENLETGSVSSTKRPLVGGDASQYASTTPTPPPITTTGTPGTTTGTPGTTTGTPGTTSVTTVSTTRTITPKQEEDPGLKNKDEVWNFNSTTPARGLHNLGNTCYFNSTMQPLVHTNHVFREKLRTLRTKGEFVREVLNFFVDMQHHNSRAYSPATMRRLFGKKSPKFSDLRQHDSHECLRNFLDNIRKEERDSSDIIDKRKVLTVVDSVFGGYFMTVYICEKCKTPYHVCEALLDISLPIMIDAQDLAEMNEANRRREERSRTGKHPYSQYDDSNGPKTPDSLIAINPTDAENDPASRRSKTDQETGFVAPSQQSESSEQCFEDPERNRRQQDPANENGQHQQNSGLDGEHKKMVEERYVINIVHVLPKVHKEGSEEEQGGQYFRNGELVEEVGEKRPGRSVEEQKQLPEKQADKKEEVKREFAEKDSGEAKNKRQKQKINGRKRKKLKKMKRKEAEMADKKKQNEAEKVIEQKVKEREKKRDVENDSEVAENNRQKQKSNGRKRNKRREKKRREAEMADKKKQNEAEKVIEQKVKEREKKRDAENDSEEAEIREQGKEKKRKDTVMKDEEVRDEKEKRLEEAEQEDKKRQIEVEKGNEKKQEEAENEDQKKPKEADKADEKKQEETEEVGEKKQEGAEKVGPKKQEEAGGKDEEEKEGKEKEENEGEKKAEEAEEATIQEDDDKADDREQNEADKEKDHKEEVKSCEDAEAEKQQKKEEEENRDQVAKAEQQNKQTEVEKECENEETEKEFKGEEVKIDMHLDNHEELEIEQFLQRDDNKDGDERSNDYRKAVKKLMTPLSFPSSSEVPNNEKYITIDNCLMYFTRKERINKEYLCNDCYGDHLANGGKDLFLTSATKQTLIFNPPAILTLHLKRFELKPGGSIKRNDKIIYGELLDLAPYCSSMCLRNDPPCSNIWYSLYGVVVHHGDTLTSGHYVAYVKIRDNDVDLKKFLQEQFFDRDLTTEQLVEMMAAKRERPTACKQTESSQSEKWYRMNDSWVEEVKVTDVLKQKAYLLFYERMDCKRETMQNCQF